MDRVDRTDKTEIPDFTENFVKIFSLARDIRMLRKAFPKTSDDGRARKDREFVEKWLSIKAGRKIEGGR